MQFTVAPALQTGSLTITGCNSGCLTVLLLNHKRGGGELLAEIDNSLSSQTQSTPVQIAFSNTHGARTLEAWYVSECKSGKFSGGVGTVVPLVPMLGMVLDTYSMLP